MTRTLTLLAGALLCMFSFQTFAQDYRLIGYRENIYNITWAPEDSMTFTYSNGRGSGYHDFVFNNSSMKYDTLYTVDWDGSTFQNGNKTIQSYNQQNLKTQSLSLTATDINISNSVYDYDVNNNLSQVVAQFWLNNIWQNTIMRLYTYDNNNNMIEEEQQMWDNTNNVWKPSTKVLYDYDQDNNVIKYLSLYYNPGTSQYDSIAINLYHYSNNLLDTIWKKNWNNNTNGKTVYTYQNSLNTTTYSFNWNNGNNSWEPTFRRFLLYQGINNILVDDSTQIWDNNTATWTDYRVETHNLNNDDYPVSIVYKSLNILTGMLQYSWLDTFVYNSGHQIIWGSGLAWDSNSQTFAAANNSREYFYYYEQYTNDVKNTDPNAAAIEIFPSPANDNINIRANFETPEAFKIQIYDMQGRLVMQTGEKATKEYNKNIQLNNLASGNYIIQLKGSNTNFQKQFSILK